MVSAFERGEGKSFRLTGPVGGDSCTFPMIPQSGAAFESYPKGLSSEEIVQSLLSHQLRITSYVRVIVKDLQLAEDIFQEVCVAALKAEAPFDSPDGVVRWAMRVGHNRAIDQVRRRKTQGTVFSTELLGQLAEDWVDHREDASYSEAVYHRLEACLNKLTPKSRSLLRMRYVEGKAPVHIAVHLKQKIQSVYKAITRAHASLRRCMGQQR